MRSQLLGLQMRRCVLQPLNLTAVLFPSHLARCVTECGYGRIKRQREQADTHISNYAGVCLCMRTPMCTEPPCVYCLLCAVVTFPQSHMIDCSFRATHVRVPRYLPALGKQSHSRHWEHAVMEKAFLNFSEPLRRQGNSLESLLDRPSFDC